jgi:hypothetical protein
MNHAYLAQRSLLTHDAEQAGSLGAVEHVHAGGSGQGSATARRTMLASG